MGILKAWNRILVGVQNVHASGNALHTLDETQAQIHQKSAYNFGRKFTIPAGDVVWLAGKTSARKVHFHGTSVVVAGGGPVEIDMYHESVVTSGSGTNENAAGNVHNRDLSVTSSSQMQIISGPTVTTTGSLIFPGANPAAPSLGGRSVGTEVVLLGGFILASSETYLIGLKNAASLDAATVWANFGFSEPINL